jgi:small GTP-binding protein
MEIKVCIIGDTDVGKTSLSTRYCHGEFLENSTPTIGASFLQRRVMVDNTEINLQIWDTAGQERFRSMAPMYYRGAKAAICVFDVTNEESYHRVMIWLKDLRTHADPNVVVCLAGNKCDREAAFDLDKCEELAKSIGGNFVRTSAKTGENVDLLFTTLSNKICEVYRTKRKEKKDADKVKLGSGEEQAPSGVCC